MLPQLRWTQIEAIATMSISIDTRSVMPQAGPMRGRRNAGGKIALSPLFPAHLDCLLAMARHLRNSRTCLTHKPWKAVDRS
jgi:hypothetical protein